MDRYGIFVHDPDGDSGDGVIVGAVSSRRADEKAASIRRRGELQGREVECIILPMVSGGTSAREIAARVVQPDALEEVI
jgi:hypothetical protein